MERVPSSVRAVTHERLFHMGAQVTSFLDEIYDEKAHSYLIKYGSS